jgi:hypothetical protein
VKGQKFALRIVEQQLGVVEKLNYLVPSIRSLMSHQMRRALVPADGRRLASGSSVSLKDQSAMHAPEIKKKGRKRVHLTTIQEVTGASFRKFFHLTTLRHRTRHQ